MFEWLRRLALIVTGILLALSARSLTILATLEVATGGLAMIVADHFMTVRGSRIKPVENSLDFRALTVKSPRRHHKIFRYFPVPS